MNFNENLRAYRKEKDFSQEYLAQRMKVSRQTISKWENGTAMPDLKKLTELAELFETSMDELLGTSSPMQKDESFSIEEIRSYAYSFAQNQINAYEKKNKTRQIITSLSILILAAGLIITNININSISNNLTNAINNRSSQIIYENNDYEETVSDYITVFVSNINKNDPRLAEVTFIYSPKTYAKGTVVSFVINDMLSSSLQNNDVVAELLSNGTFVATKEINFAELNSADIKIDDGSNITTERLELDWVALYRDFKDTLIEYVVIESSANKTIEFIDPDFKISWGNNEAMPSIVEAYVEVKYDNKVLESKNVKIQSEGVSSFVSLNSFTVELERFDTVYVKLIDEYGNRYYIDCVSIDKNNNSNITIEFAKGGRLSTDSNVDVQ